MSNQLYMNDGLCVTAWLLGTLKVEFVIMRCQLDSFQKIERWVYNIRKMHKIGFYQRFVTVARLQTHYSARPWVTLCFEVQKIVLCDPFLAHGDLILCYHFVSESEYCIFEPMQGVCTLVYNILCLPRVTEVLDVWLVSVLIANA